MSEALNTDENLPVPAETNDLLKNIDASQKYLTFKIDGQIYGMEIRCINEIIEFNSITRVPMTPPHMRGVINLRGNVVPVLDLAVRLGKSPGKGNKRTCIIIAELFDDEEKMDMGLVVDEVDEVMDIDQIDIEMAPQFGADIPNEFISGMGRVGEQFIVLLMLEEVLSVKELTDLVDQYSD